MAAGESAREVAQRRRERARRLTRLADAYERGADGEQLTAAVLAELPYGWTVLHDLRHPGRRRANIDHVVIGPGGVFVVDSKNWSGSVTVTGDVLRQDGRARERAVADVAEAALAVTAVIGNVPAVPVLCFVRHEPITGWARDVMVCSTSNVVQMLTSRPPMLQPATISRLLPVLVRELAPATGPGRPAPSVAPEAVGRAARSRRPARGRSGSRGRRTPRVPAGRITVLLLALVLAVALAPVGLGLVRDLAQQGVQRALGPTKAVGSTQVVAADSTHPELAITVASVVDTRVRGGRLEPPPGHRLVAVPLSVDNRGEAAWTWGDSTRLALLDEAGVAHAPTERYRRVTAGEVLPAGATVAAHDRLDATAVFEVPTGTHVSAVRLVVGPGLPVTLRWTLGG